MTNSQVLGVAILVGLALGLFVLMVKWSSFKEASKAVVFGLLFFGGLMLGLWLVDGGGHG